jgi:hypothetical protein
MAVILSRSCPRCRDYFAVVIAEQKGRRKSQPINGRCAFCGYKIQWRLLAGYGNQSSKIPPGPKLDALTAEKVFGWPKVHKHQGVLVGRKQDKAGRWRRAKVPNYSTNPLHSYSVEEPDETAWAVGSIPE